MSIVDPDWAEREYNPRVTVADTAAIVAAWPVRSAALRQAWIPQEDLRVGPHPRDLVDIFRAPAPRGTLVFIHGGYWRAFSKLETAFIAGGFRDSGLSVALMNYPLCPEVTLPELVAAVRASFASLVRDHLSDGERRRIVVAGHSAGGYLTAALAATDWAVHGLSASPLAAAMPISGVFHLEPLTGTSMNRDIRLTPAVAASLDLTRVPPPPPLPLAFAVGGDETVEFRRQSASMAAAWAAIRPTVLEVPGTNHFTVLDALADPQGMLARTVRHLAGTG